MRRSNHYEAAFEQFLRDKALPYVAVDEAKRAIFSEIELKSFDFIAYLPTKRNLLIDIKGRKAKPAKQGWSYDCWISQADLDALMTWQQVFGRDFAGGLVFAYWLADFNHLELFDTYQFRNRHYRFFAVYLDDYRPYVRTRSSRWKTVTIPRNIFNTIAIDFSKLID